MVSTRQSLEAKLCYLTIGLLFVLVLGLGHYTLTHQRAVLATEKQNEFGSSLKTLGLLLEPLLQAGDVDAAGTKLRAFQESQPELQFAVVSSENGQTILSESPGPEDNRPSVKASPARRTISYALRKPGLDEDDVYQVSIPIALRNDGAGVVSAGFSMERVNSVTEAMRHQLLFWFAVALILGIIGALLLARSITSDLRALSQGAWKVMSGDLSVQLPVRTPDEIGELTETFNLMIAQIKDDQDRLEQRANTDSLTGLYNHRFFQERLAQEINRAERHRRELSLLLLDIDHFKLFNDTHGHPAGDAALQAVSKLLKQAVRDIDVVGRYGGEEFAVVIPECTTEDALTAAERIRQAIQRHCFFGKDDETVPMTVSIGVAHYPHHSQEREGLIFASDVALYQSKSSGRNKVTAYSGPTAHGSEDTPYRFYVALHATELTTVEYLAEAIDAKHGHPQGFSRSVADLAVRIANRMGLSDEDVNSIRIGSLLRDIGQIGISESVLHKDSPLTEEERRVLESHPTLGHAIVERSPHLKSMLPGILHHHERWDGAGYPFGLAGEDIPLSGRVIGAADAYRAIRTDRPHRKSMGRVDALAEMERCAGTQFDPEIVKILLEIEQMEASPEKAA